MTTSFDPNYRPIEFKALVIGHIEEKARYVRTPAGVARFGLPIGSRIGSDADIPAEGFSVTEWFGDSEADIKDPGGFLALVYWEQQGNGWRYYVQGGQDTAGIYEGLEGDSLADLTRKMSERHAASKKPKKRKGPVRKSRDEWDAIRLREDYEDIMREAEDLEDEGYEYGLNELLSTNPRAISTLVAYANSGQATTAELTEIENELSDFPERVSIRHKPNGDPVFKIMK